MNCKHIFLLLYIIFLSNTLALSQTITVLDISNLEPIPQVLVFNSNKSNYAVSNIKGIVDISAFKINDTIFFQHSGYKSKTLIYNDLKDKNTVFLSESVVNISEVLVSANKWEQNKQEISNKIRSIQLKDIEFQNSQTTADMLQAGGEVYVQKSQLGGGSPMIRGFATNSVLIIIDGVRLNNAIYRKGNLQNIITLDVNAMEGSEILFGPGSVMYGSDALGGVIDFHTRTPLLSPNNKILFKTNSLVRYSSANNENTFHTDFILANNKISSVTSITLSKYSDLKMGTKGNNNEQYWCSKYVKHINSKDSVVINDNKNIQKHSGYSQINLMQKVKYKINKHVNLEYAFHYSKSSNIPRYDALRQTKKGKLKFAEWYYGPQIWQMHSFKTNVNKNTTLFDYVKITTAYQNYKESRITRKFNENNEISQIENVNILSVNTDFNKQINNKLYVFYGGEFIFNNLKSTAKTKNIKTDNNLITWTLPRYPDGKNNYFSGAMYVGSKYKLSHKTVLNAGLRYSYIHLYSTFENNYYKNFGFANTFTNKNSAINGSIGIAYLLTTHTQLNMNISSGFQAPNWDGLGKVFTPKKGVVIVPNKNLKPQYAYNFEPSIIQYFFNKKTSIEFSGFYTIVNNPIVQDKFTLNNKDSILYNDEKNKIEAFVNAKNATIYGVNIAIHANLIKSFGIKTFFTYTQGKDNNNNRLRHVPPPFARLHLLYQTLKFKADFYGVYNGEVNNLPNSEKGKDYMYAIDNEGNLYSPQWYTLNLKLSYILLKKLQLSIGIENILNNRYRPYSSGIVAPGRNFIVSIRYKI